MKIKLQSFCNIKTATLKLYVLTPLCKLRHQQLAEVFDLVFEILKVHVFQINFTISTTDIIFPSFFKQFIQDLSLIQDIV